jgi:hypothetical protein
MPGGDRRGPAGQGPRTGRAVGFCAGNDEPGYLSRGGGRGGGAGGGAGRGAGRGGGGGGRGGGGRFRNWFHATGLTGWQRGVRGGAAASGPATGTSPPADTEALQRRIAELERSLAALEARLGGSTGTAGR